MTIENNIESNKEFLCYLCKSNKKVRKILINLANKKQIYALCEIILNILNGNLQVDDKQYKKLAKYKKNLRKLINKTTIKEKKHIIQKGGF